MNKKRKKLIYLITLCAIMAGLAIVLDKISLYMGVIKITFYALPLIVVGIVEGLLPGLVAGAIAGIVLQLTSPYGITPTSAFWALAPIAWGAIPGLISSIFKKKSLTNYPLMVTIAVVVASIVANLLNTLAFVMDTLLVKDSYYTMAMIITNWPSRLLLMAVNMVPYIIISYLTMQAIRNVIYGEELETKEKDLKKRNTNFIYAIFYLSILTILITSFLLIDIVLNKYKTYILVVMIVNVVMTLAETVFNVILASKETNDKAKSFSKIALLLSSLALSGSVIMLFTINIIK